MLPLRTNFKVGDQLRFNRDNVEAGRARGCDVTYMFKALQVCRARMSDFEQVVEFENPYGIKYVVYGSRLELVEGPW